MKLSKRQAIQYCMEMWEILARTGGWDKGVAYKELRRKNPKLPSSIYGYCFACEYDETHKVRYCDNTCILTDVWEGRSCDDHGTPYDRWERVKTSRTRKKYAKEIADGCRKLLKEMDKK